MLSPLRKRPSRASLRLTTTTEPWVTNVQTPCTSCGAALAAWACDRCEGCFCPACRAVEVCGSCGLQICQPCAAEGNCQGCVQATGDATACETTAWDDRSRDMPGDAVRHDHQAARSDAPHENARGPLPVSAASRNAHSRDVGADLKSSISELEQDSRPAQARSPLFPARLVVFSSCTHLCIHIQTQDAEVHGLQNMWKRLHPHAHFLSG